MSSSDPRHVRTKVRRKVLQKMVLLPQCASALVSWASSPRLRRIFDREFCTEFLDGKRTLGVPSRTLSSVRAQLATLSSLPKGNVRFEEALNRVSELEQILAYQPPRHAECEIIIRAKRDQSSPPRNYCNYIGNSKLSCFCCQAFIRRWNDIYQTDWTCKGSHQKLYMWGIFCSLSDISDETLGPVVELVASDVCQTFRERCKAVFQVDAAPVSATSDSSGTSEERGPRMKYDESKDEMMERRLLGPAYEA